MGIHKENERLCRKLRTVQISAAIGEIQNLGDENFKYRLVSALCKLSDSDWTALENLVDMISEKK